MEDSETAVDPVAPTGWLSNLAAVVVRPRGTMRRILDRLPDRMVIPLVVLAVFSSALSDFDPREFRKVAESFTPVSFALLIVGGLIAAVLIALLLFYLFSWIATGVGRLLGGQGRPREVRSALAWGFTPFIWALAYQIPVAFLLPESAGRRSLASFRLGSEKVIRIPENVSVAGCGIVLALAILDLAVLAWYLYVASNTVAEAHRFSGGKGFATLIFSWVSPLIIILAAALTFTFSAATR